MPVKVSVKVCLFVAMLLSIVGSVAAQKLPETADVPSAKSTAPSAYVPPVAPRGAPRTGLPLKPGAEALTMATDSVTSDNHIQMMPYWTLWGGATGYVKLVTPIVHDEGNMFQLRIYGYDYGRGHAFDARCSGYAQAGNTLVPSQSTCMVTGSDLPVQLDKETGSGGTKVVIRIGRPTTAWYYPSFTAEYIGWTAKTADGFSWVAGDTTPADTGLNDNKIAMDSYTGRVTIGAGPAATDRLRLNLATAGGVVFGGFGNALSRVHVAGSERVAMTVNARYENNAWVRDDAGTTGLVVAADARAGVAPFAITRVFTPNGGGTSTEALLTLNNAGDLSVKGAIEAKYQDVAEWVPSTGTLAAGTVVVLNPTRVNEVMSSARPYDTTVAGVVSAQPGLLLGEPGADKAKIATTGRVKVRVDATKQAVAIGDLLVTSDKPGTAMVSSPVDLGGVAIHRPGTIIGKALEPLAKGEGEILVLLSLQ